MHTAHRNQPSDIGKHTFFKWLAAPDAWLTSLRSHVIATHSLSTITTIEPSLYSVIDTLAVGAYRGAGGDGEDV
jgi:hypothetical protein